MNEIKDPPTPQELYRACSRLCADQEFQMIWEFMIGQECDKVLEKMQNSATKGSDLEAARDTWNTLRIIQTQPWQFVEDYNRNNPEPPKT